MKLLKRQEQNHRIICTYADLKIKLQIFYKLYLLIRKIRTCMSHLSGPGLVSLRFSAGLKINGFIRSFIIETSDLFPHLVNFFS